MHLYRFHHAWSVTADAIAVRALAEDVAGYGAWWPAVRVLEATGGPRRSGVVEVRPPLGYRIRIRLTEQPSTEHELRAAVSGDLEGWCAWSIRAEGPVTRVAFDQAVVARALPLRLARPARRLLEGQHAAVLRAAETGMRAALER